MRFNSSGHRRGWCSCLLRRWIGHRSTMKEWIGIPESWSAGDQEQALHQANCSGRSCLEQAQWWVHRPVRFDYALLRAVIHSGAFSASLHFAQLRCIVNNLQCLADMKSADRKVVWGFKSPSGHQNIKTLEVNCHGRLVFTSSIS